MKQYKLIQVALLAILLFGWAGCSQNEEEVPGNVRNGIVLNVTDTGIISNEPSTRTEDTDSSRPLHKATRLDCSP